MQGGGGMYRGYRDAAVCEDFLDEFYDCHALRRAWCGSKFPKDRRVRAASLVLLILVIWCCVKLGSIVEVKVRMMKPPVPTCFREKSCIQEFVVTSSRVWSPPPVWLVEDYMREFGVWHSPHENVSQSDMAYYIIHPSPSEVESACLTWGSTQGVGATFLVLRSNESSVQGQISTESCRVVVLESKGHGGFGDQVHALEALADDFHAAKKLWYYLGGNGAMPFPDRIPGYLSQFDPEMPLILGRVLSSASPSIPSAIGSVLYEDSSDNPGSQVTWSTISSGMIISREGMSAILTLVRGGGCGYLGTIELTISSCAWKSGVFIANSDRFLPSVNPQDSQHVCSFPLSVYVEPSLEKDTWFVCRMILKSVELGRNR